MRSIQRRFEVFKERNKNIGDYINFVKAVKNQNFSRETIGIWFKKLVPKEDYSEKERKHLIEHLVAASNQAEDKGF